MFDMSVLSTAVSFYALGVAAFLFCRSPRRRCSAVAVIGLLFTSFVCLLAIGNLLGVGPVLFVEYNGASFAFANFLIMILAVLAVLFIERWRRDEVMQMLEYRASHDVLTGLPNRDKFANALMDELGRAEKIEGKTAVFLLDLDRFKDINDTLGHSVGDHLLQELGTRLCKQMPKNAMLARFGGDEFALLLADAHDEAAAENFARSIIDEIRRPFLLDGLILDVGASIGGAIFPEHGATSEALLQHADTAMYKAKHEHTGYEVYSPEGDPHSLRSLTLTGDLRRAIDADELDLVFQPKVKIHNSDVVGAEVLARWDRAGHGPVSPEEFIDHAEQCGLIFPLTKWVLNSALGRASAWHQAGHEIELAVNISARLLHHAALVPTIASMLKKWDYPAKSLALEITENAILANPSHAMETVAQLASLGTKVSIDDFGTGYSSLAYLKNLAAHELKIDKSFVLGMVDCGTDRTIVSSVISLAHDLGLTVVAEGVETEKARTLLMEFSCDVGQGYYCGEPMTAAALEYWLLMNAEQAAAMARRKRRGVRRKTAASVPRLLPARDCQEVCAGPGFIAERGTCHRR